MYCPFCDCQDTKVLDSRPAQEGYSVRRRRQCPKCQARFTTYEMADIDLPQIMKRDGRREAFQREKLKSGLHRALEKRPISAQQIDQTVDEITQKLRAYGEPEIPAHVIGEWMMEALRQLDNVGYIRFASVYLSFQDLNAFRTAIEQLENRVLNDDTVQEVAQDPYK